MVGVKVGKGVSVTSGVPVGGVVVGCAVLITNKSGVFEAGKPNGVAVGPNVFTGVAVCRNGSEGNPLHPDRREMIRRIKTVFFMKHLLCHLCHTCPTTGGDCEPPYFFLGGTAISTWGIASSLQCEIAYLQ